MEEQIAELAAQVAFLQAAHQHLTLGHPLGRHVQEAQPRLGRVGRVILDCRRLCAVGCVCREERSAHTRLDELVDLVFHQRDERRDDEREPGPHEPWQLVEQRLARASRQDSKHVLH